ncbi:uncharacterized protein METZ01_LOCUS83312 [marine metagenome]|uniref:Uncharacterized protein n=1 Tax=marine metagenome TaxID=408172 RepID=A0A381US51_9ZZZZ
MIRRRSSANSHPATCRNSAMRWSATLAQSSVGVGSMPFRSHASRTG